MTGPPPTSPEWITGRWRPGSSTCASSTGRSMVGSSCAWTSFAGQHGALDPQGRTSVLDRCVTDRERLRFTVLDRPFEHDDRMPISRQRRPPPERREPFLMQCRGHALRLRDVATGQHVGLDVVLHERRGIAEVGELELLQLTFDERECLAGLDQVLRIDLLAAEALQLLGDGVDRGFGEIDDEFSGDVKAAGTLLRKDVTGRKRLARLRSGIPWKDPPRH